MKFINRSDIVVLVAVLAACVVCFYLYHAYTQGQAAVAEIYYRSELVATIDLTQGIEKRFSVPENEDVIFHLYEDGSICFEESDCPDKICIHSGRLDTIGQTAACIPNELVLKIVAKNGHSEVEFDAVVG